MGRVLVTGATGFVGGHLAERLRSGGYEVTTVARHSSDTTLLESWGVRIVRGDLGDASTLVTALEDVDIVVNCAAKVGDWGPVEEYRKVNVESLAVLLELVRTRNLKRFIHLSSLGVYAARDHDQTDESEPPPEHHMDGYTQTKVESEKLALGYHQAHGVPVVVLRPGFIYGPRDRTVLPRLIDSLRRGIVRYLGDKTKVMNTIYVGNLVDAILLAMEKNQAVGQVYNLTDDEVVTKQRFMETICRHAELPPPTKTVPLGLAKVLAAGMEGWAKLTGKQQAPRLTRARVKFLGLNLSFSVTKAKRELGYQPRVQFDAGMAETMAWWKAQGKEP
jgi:nucleoside-diphosphate-sugar epimerase